MIKKKYIFESIVIVETVIIIMVAIVMFAGYPISLMLNGFASQNSEILYAGIDGNENEYRVVELRDGGKIKEVAIFTKTFLPIWKKIQSAREKDGLTLEWTVSTGLKTYGMETVDINFAFHSVYCGNDAVKKIESIAEYLPENTTAEIRQLCRYRIG